MQLAGADVVGVGVGVEVQVEVWDQLGSWTS